MTGSILVYYDVSYVVFKHRGVGGMGFMGNYFVGGLNKKPSEPELGVACVCC